MRSRAPQRLRRSICSSVAERLELALLTDPRLFGCLQRQLAKMARPPFEFCVDEALDIGMAELRFLAARGAGRPDALFFAGDFGRRIFQTPASAPWGSTSAGARTPCGSTTAPPIRSGGKRTGCSRPRPRTWTGWNGVTLHALFELC